MVDERVAERAACGEQPRHRDRRGALDVVVEARHAVAVARQERNRRRVVEVLELDARARIDLLHGHHELLDEGVVVCAAQTLLTQARVELVGEEALVVRADIEYDGHAARGRHAADRGVERELADGNAHPADAEVAEAEDPFAVGHADDAHIHLGPVAQDLRDAAAVLERDIEPLRAPHDVTELLARLADGRGVDDRHVARRVCAEQLVEEPLVPVLQFREIDVALEVVRAAIKLRKRAQLLRGAVLDRIGKEAREPQQLALCLAEGGALVQARVVEDLVGVLAHGAALKPFSGIRAIHLHATDPPRRRRASPRRR